MLRSVVAYLLLLGLIGTVVGSPVSASAQRSARQQQGRIQKQILRTSQHLKELKEQKSSLEGYIKTLDDKKKEKEAEVKKIEDQLQLSQQSLNRAQAEKKEIEGHLSGYRGALGGRMRAVYMMGDMTYLDMLFSADSFSDFVDRVFYVQTICGRDEDLIDKTQHDQQMLAEKIMQINTKVDEIARYRASQRVQLGDITALKREKNDDLETIESDVALAERQKKEMEAQSAAIGQLIRSGSSSASGYKGMPWTASFKRPCGGPIMSGFGYRVHPISHVRKMHTGVDLGAGYGADVHAAGNGKVIRTGWFGGYGNCVIIDHGGKPNRSTLYGHLSQITCVSGQEVKVGTVIGKVGSTGYSTGPHLHFEVRINGNPVDPLTN